MKRVRARGKNAASGGRDWSRIDWTKTNTQLAKELGVVRGTVHTQRKRYAPESLLYKNYDPNPEPTTITTAPPPPKENITTITTNVTNTPKPPNDLITIQPPTPRHWSQTPTTPRIPKDPTQHPQISVKAGDQIITLHMLRETLQHQPLTSLQLANALQLTWNRDLHAAFEAFVDLGALTGTHQYVTDHQGGAFQRTYTWRTHPNQESTP